MPAWTAQRNAYAEQIFQAFEGCPFIQVHRPNSDHVHAYYKCYVQVIPEALPAGWSRDRIMQEINALGVPCLSGSCSEVYLEHAFDGTPWRPAQRLPNAQRLGETSLMFLVHPSLTADNMARCIDAIQQVLAEIAKAALN